LQVLLSLKTYGANKIIECPRAMQGIKPFILPKERLPTFNLYWGRFWFNWFWDFVSPKAIPQMQDTAAVLAQLDLSQTVNYGYYSEYEGAEIAKHTEIRYLGFPFRFPRIFRCDVLIKL
jgi:hydroxymethylglutaryl-CoA lyase